MHGGLRMSIMTPKVFPNPRNSDVKQQNKIIHFSLNGDHQRKKKLYILVPSPVLVLCDLKEEFCFAICFGPHKVCRLLIRMFKVTHMHVADSGEDLKHPSLLLQETPLSLSIGILLCLFLSITSKVLRVWKLHEMQQLQIE